VILSLAACGSVGQLGKFKAHWNEQDYAWIAEQEVACTASEEGCNQLHLLKGDACFRVAKQGVEARTHYACAATHLETGIAMTANWQAEGLNLNRAQTYENLCEALRERQDLEQGEAAEGITGRLLATAQAFLAAEPAHPGAVYFLNSARFTLLRKELLHPADAGALCGKLNELLRALDGAGPGARGTRYEASFQKLRADVAGAKGAVAGCE
jgi:hypothetical protein